MNEVLQFGVRPALFTVNLVRGSDASFAVKLVNSQTGDPIEPTSTDAVLTLAGLPFVADKAVGQYSWTILAADVTLISNGSKAELAFVQGNRRRVHATGKVFVR